MATFEDATEEQKVALSKAGFKLFHSSDPEVREAARRALMKADTSVRFPEIETSDLVDGKMKESADQIKELQQQIMQTDARRMLEDQRAAARARGLDPAEVEKAITERGIANWDTAMEFVELTHRSAQPTPAAYDEPADVLPQGKDFWDNPQKASRTMAHQAVDELMQRRKAQR